MREMRETYVMHELLAEYTNIAFDGRREHHDLLLMRGQTEDHLHILSHVEGAEHIITLVKNETLEVVHLQALLGGQLKNAARGTDDDVGWVVLELFTVLGYRHTTVEHTGLHGRHVLAEAVELVTDLVGELASVAEHQSVNYSVHRFDLLKDGQHKHSGLSHTTLGLADHIRTEDSLRDAFMLNVRGMFKTTVTDGAEKLRLEQQFLETRRVHISMLTAELGSCLRGGGDHLLIAVVLLEVVDIDVLVAHCVS
mmetsp:Transcript_40622/g.102257  ORF Transcript_40622/g.102257 Transcript_40622/m.102257 type:complete len:253 (+) Transcript_40622:2946-3704(+)